jgi:hypothetical protein
VVTGPMPVMRASTSPRAASVPRSDRARRSRKRRRRIWNQGHSSSGTTQGGVGPVTRRPAAAGPSGRPPPRSGPPPRAAHRRQLVGAGEHRDGVELHRSQPTQHGGDPVGGTTLPLRGGAKPLAVEQDAARILGVERDHPPTVSGRRPVRRPPTCGPSPDDSGGRVRQPGHHGGDINLHERGLYPVSSQRVERGRSLKRLRLAEWTTKGDGSPGRQEELSFTKSECG